MNYVLFHIPHASLKIPKIYFSICVKDFSYISKTNLFLSDYLVDQLLPYHCHKLIFPYSRIFCDVERFKDDSIEKMFQKSMGVIYTRDCENEIAVSNNRYKRKVIQSYYDKHHCKLDKMVTTALHKNRHVIIVDFHSFSDEMIQKLFGSCDNPDICIGVDENYTNYRLVHFTVVHFESYGYTVEINNPYSGTIIPNKYIHHHDDRLTSIMLEMNKRIYLNRYSDFMKLKVCIDEYYQKIKNFSLV